MTISDTAETGYILEVDLTYPRHLHVLHNQYPLAVEHLTITPDMLSPQSLSIAEKLNRTPAPCQKLVPNLRDKQRYVVHYRNLQLYCSLGMVVTRIRRVMAFRQTAWLKPYIECNIRLRKLAQTTFEKDFFKLLSNSCYG